jgi:hypothetical protein
MKIYNAAGVEILDIQADDKSYLYKAIREISSLTLYFKSVSFIEIPLGSYVEFLGETYYLEDPQNFKKYGSRNFEYTLVLDSAWVRSGKYKVRNIVDGRLKFDLTATPADHLQLIIDNMNLRDLGWSVGLCIEATEKLISYNHIYCKDALEALANEFNTEWEVIGKTINLKKVEYYKDAPLPLSYGMGNGFKPGLGRMNLSSSRPVSKLYVQGGSRNIDFSKYGSSELLLPKSQQLEYEGRTYVTDDSGLFITRLVPGTSGNEDSLDASHIYPSRVGSISSVEVIDEDNNFYDIIDNSIPADLNFEDCLVAGETLTIIFQSGILSGREFEARYTHSGKRFEIVPAEIDGQTMPNATFVPSVGDKYAVFGISLPDAYICDNVSQAGASWDMFREGVKYLYEHEEQQFSFTGDLDGIWAKNNWLEVGAILKPGGYVLFSDAQFQQEGVLVRIISVKHILNNPYSPVLELSNAPSGGTVAGALKKIDANEVVTEKLHKDAISYTKRRFRDSQETIKMIEAAFTNFSGSVNPVTVQTMALLVGDESLQYRFVDDMVTPAPVAHNVTFNAVSKVLTSPAGIIQHMTLGIKTISSSHNVAEYKFWNVALYNSPALEESDKSYYLYAKVSKVNQTGVFLLSEPPIAIEEVAGYYHLLVGILNMENDEGDRSYVDLYGYSEILPGRITTEKIVSPTGNTFIDLVNEIIQGKFTFQSGSSGYGNLADKPSSLNDINTGEVSELLDEIGAAQDTADGATDAVNNLKIGARNFIAKKFILNWNLIDPLVVQDGEDADGMYFSINQWSLYQSIAGGAAQNAIFPLTFKTLTQYAFKVKWKIAGIQGSAGLHFRFHYSDGTIDNVYLFGSQNTLTERTYITSENKTLVKISSSYSDNTYRSLIYEIQLTEGNRQTESYIMAEEDAANIKIGARNFIAKQFIRDWNLINSIIVLEGEDADGRYLAINQGSLYQSIAGGAAQNAIFPLTFKPLTQYAFKVKWKIAGIQGSAGLHFRFHYSDGTIFNMYLFGSQTSLLERTYTTSATKTLVKISSSYSDNTYRSLIYEIQLTEGNRQTESYIMANEDYNSASIEAIEYLKKALQNNTSVQGGLLATSLIRLGAVNQAGTWIEKAGLNGIAGNINTPRFWSGGTLAQAIARVAGDLNGAKTVITEGGKIFGREVELYGNLGTAPSGERIVLDQASKAIIIYDANNVPKTIISSSAIPTLEVLLQGNSAQVDATKSASVEVTNANDEDVQYSAILTLPAGSANYTVVTPPIPCSCAAIDFGEGGPEIPRGASAACAAMLVLPDNSEVFLGGISASATGDPGSLSDSQQATIPSQQFSGLPAGNYRIKLIATAFAASTYANAEALIHIVAPNVILSGESAVNVSRIHRDGMFIITDASHYHYISPTREVVKNDEVRGFGVLAAAYVQSNGTLTNNFNSIISNVTAHGSGLYTITHNLGHLNYSPIVTVSGDNDYSASVLSVGVNSFQVRTRSAGNGTNLAFYIQISG